MCPVSRSTSKVSGILVVNDTSWLPFSNKIFLGLLPKLSAFNKTVSPASSIVSVTVLANIENPILGPWFTQ